MEYTKDQLETLQTLLSATHHLLREDRQYSDKFKILTTKQRRDIYHALFTWENELKDLYKVEETI